MNVSSLALIVGTNLANAQSAISLDPVSVIATKTPEKNSESLAAVSSVRQDTLIQFMPSRPSNILFGMPGVWFQERADDPGTAVSIRGLQDFGRVAVTIDGARQNFQRTGHNANGVFYLEPELISGADVVRGPVANIYGSGAIGGVVSFNTKDTDDILKPGQRVGILSRGELGSNVRQGVGSTFVAARPNENVDFMFGGTYRSQASYKSGDGTTVPNTGYNSESAIAKLNLRPADGHQIKLGYIDYQTGYTIGQPFIVPPGIPGFGFLTGVQYGSIFATDVRNQIANARWLYSKPEDRLFDFDGNVYWTSTGTDQKKIGGPTPAQGGIGNIGDTRNFTIETTGFDIHNSSRFDTGPVKHTLTLGVDGFRDDVNTRGFGVVFTPTGQRTVSGGFVQLKSQYWTWLETIGAVRYDRYSLDGAGVGASGDRVSPKITVGFNQFRNIVPYVTYAEGYRAPATTETLIAGVHPVAFAPFTFLPNPTLRPEVGKTKEFGINMSFDNVFRQGDGFRGKVNVYRNDVSNYIDLFTVLNGQTSGGFTCATAFFNCQQYQNIPGAKLDGAEFEMNYDAGLWFAGLAGSHVRGRNITTGAPLATVAPDSLTTTVGARFLDRKLTVALRWQAVAAKPASEIPTQTVNGTTSPVFAPTNSYNLINLYTGYEINSSVTAGLAIENLLNQQYVRYMSSIPNPLGSGNPIALPSPGITVRGSLKIQFGDDFFKQQSRVDTRGRNG